jgi:hypothetical protein
VSPFRAWTKLILAAIAILGVIAFGLVVATPTLAPRRGGLYLDPGHPDPRETRAIAHHAPIGARPR